MIFLVKQDNNASQSENTKARAPRRTVVLTVEKTNGTGIFAQGVWHDYGRIFDAKKKLSQASAGERVELTEAFVAKTQKWVVVDLQKVEEDSHDETEPEETTIQKPPAKAETASGSDAPAEEPVATPGALVYAEDLARDYGIPSANLDAGCKLLFKKSFNAISGHVATKLIEAYGGYPLGGGSKRPERR